MAASVGQLHGAPIEFELVLDVPCGGVLLAIPALIQNGLLSGVEKIFSMEEGFYPIETIFLVLALVALARVGSLEQLRYVEAGEWGKLLGLDRIPEVRTLRQKIGELCSVKGRVEEWSGELARQWMADDPQSAGVFYADGHVRLYHGSLTKLPRRYVSRERLCLRGTSDYWINAMDGQPFFRVSRAADPGLIIVLREDVVPRLLLDTAGLPGQPSAEALEQDPLLNRLTLVFDREGYSPAFFAEMKEKRVAILTYHKFSDAEWPESEFSPQEVTLVNGEKTILALAERGARLSNGLWVRELRQRCEKSGHQTSILCTDYRAGMTRIAAGMFARWCQENFFKYMREHYGIDRLVEYGSEPLPETTKVVNPAWRALDAAIRRERALLSRESARFGKLHFPADLEPAKMAAIEEKKRQLNESCEARKNKLEELTAQRKETPKHLEMKDLPKNEQFERLRPDKKHFVDTIKLIAYRAETAMAALLREVLPRTDDARSLLRCLYQSAVNLIPNHTQKTLTVQLHHFPTAAQDLAIKHLCEELNATETLFPSTELRLVFQIGSSS